MVTDKDVKGLKEEYFNDLGIGRAFEVYKKYKESRNARNSN